MDNFDENGEVIGSLNNICDTKNVSLEDILSIINKDNQTSSASEDLILAILLYPDVIKAIITKNELDKSSKSLSNFKGY